MNKDNNNNFREKKHNLQKRARPTIYYAYALRLNAESIHRLLSSCHCIMLICQRRRTNEGFHKWSASENEKLHYALMKFLSSSSSILKGPRRDFPFAWCGATGTRIYPSPLRLLAKKKKITNQGETAWGWNGEVDPAAAPSLRPSLTREMPFSSTLIFVCVAQWNLFCNTRLRSSGP